jgi:hypothetical protein
MGHYGLFQCKIYHYFFEREIFKCQQKADWKDWVVRGFSQYLQYISETINLSEKIAKTRER